MHVVAVTENAVFVETFALHAALMKFVPVTVMVLPAYADAGVMEPAVGLPTTVSVDPATEAVFSFPIVVNVTCTDDAVPGRAAEGVPDPITTTTVVALAYVHEVAGVPEPAFAPTFAVHAALVRQSAPVTVIVLPAYAAVGEIDVTVGSGMMVSVVPATVATLSPFVNVTFTVPVPGDVPVPITTVTVVALWYAHVAAVDLTMAVHANPERK